LTIELELVCFPGGFVDDDLFFRSRLEEPFELRLSVDLGIFLLIAGGPTLSLLICLLIVGSTADY